MAAFPGFPSEVTYPIRTSRVYTCLAISAFETDLSKFNSLLASCAELVGKRSFLIKIMLDRFTGACVLTLRNLI